MQASLDFFFSNINELCNKNSISIVLSDLPDIVSDKKFLTIESLAAELQFDISRTRDVFLLRKRHNENSSVPILDMEEIKAWLIHSLSALEHIFPAVKLKKSSLSDDMIKEFIEGLPPALLSKLKGDGLPISECPISLKEKAINICGFSCFGDLSHELYRCTNNANNLSKIEILTQKPSSPNDIKYTSVILGSKIHKIGENIQSLSANNNYTYKNVQIDERFRLKSISKIFPSELKLDIEESLRNKPVFYFSGTQNGNETLLRAICDIHGLLLRKTIVGFKISTRKTDLKTWEDLPECLWEMIPKTLRNYWGALYPSGNTYTERVIQHNRSTRKFLSNLLQDIFLNLQNRASIPGTSLLHFSEQEEVDYILLELYAYIGQVGAFRMGLPPSIADILTSSATLSQFEDSNAPPPLKVIMGTLKFEKPTERGSKRLLLSTGAILSITKTK